MHVQHAVLAEPVGKEHPTLAYDRMQCRVLSVHLSSPDGATQLAGLISLQRLVTDEKTAYKVHEAGLLDQLAHLALSAAATAEIRRISLDCISYLLASPALRTRTFSRPSITATLRAAVAHGEDLHLRATACRGLRDLAETAEGCAALLAADFVPHIVSRIEPELASVPDVGGIAVFAALLRLLRALLSHTESPAVEAALEAGVVPRLTHVIGGGIASLRLNHDGLLEGAEAAAAAAATAAGARPLPRADADECVRLACEALMFAAFPTSGKRACMQRSPGAGGDSGSCSETLAAALALVASAPVEVAAAAAGCLMTVEVEDDAKAAIVAAGGVDTLCGLLVRGAAEGSALAVIYCAKALHLLCPHPVGRRQLNDNGPALSVLRQLCGHGADDAGAGIPGVGSAVGAAARAAELCLGALKLPHEA